MERFECLNNVAAQGGLGGGCGVPRKLQILHCSEAV